MASNSWSTKITQWKDSAPWEIWGHRIVVAVALVVIYELYQRYAQHPNQVHQPPRQQTSQGNRRREMNRRIGQEAPKSIKKGKVTSESEEKESIVDKGTGETIDDDTSPPALNDDEKEVASNSTPPDSKNEVASTSTSPVAKNDKKEAGRSTQSRKSVKTSSRPLPVLSSTKDPPPIRATTNKHPGMEGFAHWCDVEASLYRIYTLTRKDGAQVVPPYIPHSYRGNTSISLSVTNNTSHTIQVFWVDYKGAHVPKGTVKPGHTWTQSTWIDHPWVFGDANNDDVFLYYIPYRAIPTLPTAPTVNPDDTSIAQHRFSLIPSKPNDSYLIGINDRIMPFPSLTHHLEPLHGITWTLTHMSRLLVPEDPSIDVLQKFLTNVIEHPEVVKYRQLRIASRHFKPIWESPMRGLLLAVGFVEQGGFAELGCQDHPLSPERVQEVALLSHLLREWKSKPNAADVEQPQGAVDGFGRAGFGRAGTIN